MRVRRLFGYLLPVVLFLTAVPVVAQRSDELTMQAFRDLDIPFYEGNKVRLLTSGEAKFADMFQAIRHARSFIHMDYYKFQDDSVCNVLFDLLREKVKAGVTVRILYDAAGNKYSVYPLRKKMLRQLRADGIQIYPFDRLTFPWINHGFHRNHHKITVVDGKVAYSGGMNVADYYIHGKPSVGEWRDMHMAVEGPLVDGYEAEFERMWQKTTGELLYRRAYQGKSLRMDDGYEVALVNRIPKVTPAIMRQAYCAAIDHAQHLVQIVNAYPTLGGPVRKSLYNALARGVRVQFMVSSQTDGKPNMDCVGMEMKKMMQCGAEVYYYEGGFHHSKVMMVDSLFCTVGTANLDARSLKYDYEINSFIFDPRTTAELQSIFQQDVQQHCVLLTPTEWKRRFPLRRRIRSRFFMLLKGLL